jgi:hypothetical protein
MPRSNFREVEVFRDRDGAIAVVSERIATGQVSFMIGREFERNGETCRSAFLNRYHIPGVERLLRELTEKLDLLEDKTRVERRIAR